MGRTGEHPLTAAFVMGVLVAVLWGLEYVDQLSGNALDVYGIRAQQLDGLPEIFTAPFLHFGWQHLIGNTVPFFVLGFLVLLGGFVRWLVSTLVSIVSSGLTAWLLTPPNTIILGASGLIFGWLTYLLARAVFARRLRQIVLAVLVLFLYGSAISEILPGAPGISWQAHLGGAVGGVLAAWLLHRRDRERRRRQALYSYSG